MATADNLNRGRDAFLRRGWTDAYMLLAAADSDEPLPPEDLERLATAAYLIGKDAESTEIWTRAHQEFLERGAVARANGPSSASVASAASPLTTTRWPNARDALGSSTPRIRVPDARRQPSQVRTRVTSPAATV